MLLVCIAQRFTQLLITYVHPTFTLGRPIVQWFSHILNTWIILPLITAPNSATESDVRIECILTTKARPYSRFALGVGSSLID